MDARCGSTTTHKHIKNQQKKMEIKIYSSTSLFGSQEFFSLPEIQGNEKKILLERER